MPTKRLSPSQRRALENLAADLPANLGVHGQSAHGGLAGTVFSLRRHGLLGWDDWLVTDKGLAALTAGRFEPAKPA